MNLPIRFLDFPEEVQHDIFDCLKKDIDVLVTLLRTCQDTYNKMQSYVHNYVLEYGLERIVKNKNLTMIETWKQYIFDSYPRGAIERQVIIAALHFIIGKYYGNGNSVERSIGRELLHHFDPLIIDKDFGRIYSMGFMFSIHPFVHTTSSPSLTMMSQLVDNNAVVKHPLFGKMTLHTANIKQVVIDRVNFIRQEGRCNYPRLK